MDTIAVLDFGGQYTHLIANRIRRLGVYSEIVECDSPPKRLGGYKGLILSGGPYSVLDSDRPGFDPSVLNLGVPVLGLCYGHQLVAHSLGGTVSRGEIREYGIAQLKINGNDPLVSGLNESEQIWMSHGDTVEGLPEGFEAIGATPDCANAAVCDRKRHIYGLQFHPEVTDTPNGMRILDNFLSLCGCERTWDPKAFLKQIMADVKERCRGRKVFLLVSGGVDSSVAFALLNQALEPSSVLGLHIDNGLMRHEESEQVMQYMKEHGFDNLRIVDASSRFLRALDGVADPEKKRAIIGETFIRVQQEALAGLGLNAEDWILGQGTIYPDTIESAGTSHADRIKTHHNRVEIVVKLMEKGLVVEPLAQLYKDEVRQLGETLGLPHQLVWRHPFPGPGLGVRVLCSARTHEELDKGLGPEVHDYARRYGFSATVLPVRSVGVQGDGRTYAHPALLLGKRDWAAMEEVSTAITNAVRGVNRVVYGVHVEGRPQYRLVEAYTTRQRLDLIRTIDDRATELLREHGQYDDIWQMPVVLLPLLNESGGQCVVLRPITSREAMTARFTPLKESILSGIVECAKQTEGIGDVFIDITHKPPGTIEWE